MITCEACRKSGELHAIERESPVVTSSGYDTFLQQKQLAQHVLSRSWVALASYSSSVSGIFKIWICLANSLWIRLLRCALSQGFDPRIGLWLLGSVTTQSPTCVWRNLAWSIVQRAVL